MLPGIGGRRRLFITGLVTLIISTGAAIVAGVILGSSSDLIALIPGLLILVPPTIDMKGHISGVFASRLASSMHLGEFEIRFGPGTVLGDNIRASIAITILLSFLLGFFANLVGLLLGIDVIGVIDLVLISIISGLVSGIIITAFTILVSIASYRYGLDLDLIGAPSVTTVGDMVTLPILIVSAPAVLLLPPPVRFALFALTIILVAWTLLYIRVSAGSLRSIVQERMLILIPLSILGIIAGATYTLEIDQLVTFAAFLILIPPFMAGCGSIGGILASRLATGMHMGDVTPTPIPERGVMDYFISTYAYTLILLPLTAIVAHYAAGALGLNSPGLLPIVAISVVAGIIIMTLVNGIAYITASMSFRYGYDPDNFGIPMITSMIDVMSASVLVAVIGLFLS